MVMVDVDDSSLLVELQAKPPSPLLAL